MGAALIADGPELAPVLSGAHLPTSEGWKSGFKFDFGRKAGH